MNDEVIVKETLAMPFSKGKRTQIAGKDFPVIQWQRLELPVQGTWGWIPDWGTKIPHGTTKSLLCPNKDEDPMLQ